MGRKQKKWSFEQKRMIARAYCGGLTRKQIMYDYDIAANTVKDIVRAFVIITRTERYPADVQLDMLTYVPKRPRGRVVAGKKK